MARVLTLGEAKAIKPPCDVWRETIGGYDRTRYGAELLQATDTDSRCMMFGGSGRAWSGYNREICGWRLWDSKPTHEELMTAKWDKFYG